MKLAALLNEKAPYLLTLLIAGLGWTLQRSVSVMTDTPTIAYSISYKPMDANRREVIAKVENISRTQRFSDLTFKLVGYSDEEGHASNIPLFVTDAAWIVPALPASVTDSASVSDDGTEATFPLHVLEPGWQVTFFAVEIGQSRPIGLEQTCDMDFADDSNGDDASGKDITSTTPVRVVHGSPATFLVKHELISLCILAAAWVAGIAVCFTIPASNSSTDTSD